MSVHLGTLYLAKYTLKNAKLKCSEISTLQNRLIKMQLKYSVLQYLTVMQHTTGHYSRVATDRGKVWKVLEF